MVNWVKMDRLAKYVHFILIKKDFLLSKFKWLRGMEFGSCMGTYSIVLAD